MPTEDKTKELRDQGLDDLLKAEGEYFDKQIKAVEHEEDLYRAVLKARGAPSSLAKANAATTKLLLVNDISSFLAG